MLKTISGHTSARGICRYLTKKNRALASDYMNIDMPDLEHPEASFDWAAVMDATRRAFGNDLPWRGKRVRTYKHYVLSPDPKDAVGLDSLRTLAKGWAQEHFSDYEVAIVYHDDNEHGIPHAHVVVNNTNLETGRRLQDADPKALAASLQNIAERQGLTPLKPPEPKGVAARAERRNPKAKPATYRAEYLRRAEAELMSRGEYSWTADIRARVRIARLAARSEEDFRSALGAMGVTVTDNSPKAQRRDWIYALADHPSRRISGERLGLSYGRERLRMAFAVGGASRLEDASAERIAAIARRAVSIGDLSELRMLAHTVELIESSRIGSLAELDALALGTSDTNGTKDAVAIASYARAAGVLPEKREPREPRIPASKREPHTANGYKLFSQRNAANRQAEAQVHRSERQDRTGGAR